MPTLNKGDWVEDGLSFLEDDSTKKKPSPRIWFRILPQDSTEWFWSVVLMIVFAFLFALAAWLHDWKHWIWTAIPGAVFGHFVCIAWQRPSR